MKALFLTLFLSASAFGLVRPLGGGGGGAWGEITGSISDQTDLNTALSGKVGTTGDETVAGTKTFSSSLLLSGGASSIYDKFLNTATGTTAASDGFWVGVAADGTGEIRHRENAAIEFYTANDRRMTLGVTGTLQIDSGTLQVGNGSGSATHTIYSAAGSTPALNIQKGTAEIRINSRVDNELSYRYNGGTYVWTDTYGAVTTTDATVTTVWSKTLADNTVYGIEASCSARRTDAADRAGYKLRGLFYREAAGGATQQGSTNRLFEVESDANFDLVFDTDSNDVRLRVTGVAAKTVKWQCRVTFEELQ